MSGRRIILAEYFTTEELTLLFGVRADWNEPQVVEIPMSLAEIRAYATRHFAPGAGDVQPLLALDLDQWQEAFGRFVEPIAAWAEPGDYLYLVPHDALHYLPLHALRVDGQYLAERNPVLYAPSASVLKYCQARRKGTRRRALVLGDSAGDLVHARAEALAVADLFGTRAYVGEAARKSVVTAQLAARRDAIDVLHFACHGRFHHQQPLKSGILLAPEADAAAPADEPQLSEVPLARYLTAEDLFGLQMNADLVTLSACESGVSEIRPGDELFGLMRALIYAGTPSVIMSLWPVDQISSGILMQDFYRRLQTPGVTKVEALQRAQLHVRDMSVREAIAYCRTAIDLLQRAGEASARSALREDMADLHYLAGDYEGARSIYETVVDELDPEADADRVMIVDNALARCEMLATAADAATAAPDFERRLFSHPFHWAPFILVGDWQ